MPSCQHCGFDAGPEAERCPLCGSAPEGDAGKRGGRMEGSAPPWEERNRPAVDRLVETWRESLFRPAPFFRRVGRSGGLAGPLLYYLLATVVGAFFALWWELAGVGPGPWQLGGDGVSPAAGALAGFFLSPFAALMSLAIWTLVLHLFVVLLVPARSPLGATARVICYSAGPSVFSAVPLLGPLVGVVWTLVLQVVGIREVHATTTGRAAAAVLVPLGLTVLAILGLAILVAVVAGSALLEFLD